MTLLVAGFVVFFIGGVVFMRGETDRSPGEARPAASVGLYAVNAGGAALMFAGIGLMVAAGIV